MCAAFGGSFCFVLYYYIILSLLSIFWCVFVCVLLFGYVISSYFILLGATVTMSSIKRYLARKKDIYQMGETAKSRKCQ